MHEAGITEDLIIAVQKALKDKNENKMIKVIHVKLGKDGHVTGESLQYWFDHIKVGHADEYPTFKEAELEITIVEGEDLVVSGVDFE